MCQVRTSQSEVMFLLSYHVHFILRREASSVASSPEHFYGYTFHPFLVPYERAMHYIQCIFIGNETVYG